MRERNRARFGADLGPMQPSVDGDPGAEEVAEHFRQLDEADQDKDWKPFNNMLQLFKNYDGTRIYSLADAED